MPGASYPSVFLATLLAASCATTSSDPTPAAGPKTAPPTATTPVAATPAARFRSRAVFARAIARLKPGMSGARVRELIGPPDDIRTPADPGGISATRTTEIWRYGTEGHLSFPTLGSVHMMAEDRVQYVFGGRGSPPTPSMFSESDLRSLLRTLNRVPSYNSGVRYDPLPVVRAVNALHPLGKKKALAALSEYLRVSSWLDDSGREGVFLVLRALFKVPTPPGHMPVMAVGAPAPRGPTDPKVLPRFPLAIVNDVPLLLVGGYMLAGKAEPPEWHLKKFRRIGVLRDKPLRPTDAPLALAHRLVGAANTPFIKRTGLADQWSRARVINQLLVMADSVFRINAGTYGARFAPGKKLDKRWQTIRKSTQKLRTRWDAATQRYTFLDGTTLPTRKVTSYQREIWRLKIANTKTASFVIERKDAGRVRAELRVQMRAGHPLPHVLVRVMGSASKQDLGVLELGKPKTPGSGSSSAKWSGSNMGVGSMMTKVMPLPAATEVTPVLEVAGKKLVGPVMRP